MYFNYKKCYKYSLCTNSQSRQQFELLFENLQLFMHTQVFITISGLVRPCLACPLVWPGLCCSAGWRGPGQPARQCGLQQCWHHAVPAMQHRDEGGVSRWQCKYHKMDVQYVYASDMKMHMKKGTLNPIHSAMSSVQHWLTRAMASFTWMFSSMYFWYSFFKKSERPSSSCSISWGRYIEHWEGRKERSEGAGAFGDSVQLS